MTKKTEQQAKAFSLDDLDATQKDAFEFEYITDEGQSTGIFLKVLGGQSSTVTKEVSRLVNERRKAQAIRAANSASRGRKEVSFDRIEDDVEFGQRLAAVRLVGWRGIAEDFTPENGLKLCQRNRDISAQITEQSDKLSNFMKL